MISSNDEEIEHFRGGGGGGRGGGGGGRGGGFGGGYGGYGGGGGYGGSGGFGGGYGSYGSGGRNANIGYRGGYRASGGYYGGGSDSSWNNYPLIYNNYIPVDTNDYDNTVLLPSEVTENFNNELNNTDKNQVSIIWYLISIILILFIIY